MSFRRWWRRRRIVALCLFLVIVRAGCSDATARRGSFVHCTLYPWFRIGVRRQRIRYQSRRNALQHDFVPRPLSNGEQSSWKLADRDDDELPEWFPGVIGNFLDSDRQDAMETSVAVASNATIFLTNPSPIWWKVAATVVSWPSSSAASTKFEESSQFVVTPNSASLAPKGGTVNLCEVCERYQDFCEFRIRRRDGIETKEDETLHYYIFACNDEGDTWIARIDP